MELKEADPGDIVNFTYRQPVGGPARRYLAKVIEVRSLTQEEIANITAQSKYRRDDPEFARSSTLVTCRLPGGKVRNFYAERSDSCIMPVMAQASYTIQDLIARSVGWSR